MWYTDLTTEEGMSIAAGYIATVLVASIGFIISQEVAEIWDSFVVRRMKEFVDGNLESVQADQ
jgi:hypothetical protein